MTTTTYAIPCEALTCSRCGGATCDEEAVCVPAPMRTGTEVPLICRGCSNYEEATMRLGQLVDCGDGHDVALLICGGCDGRGCEECDDGLVPESCSVCAGMP